MKCKYPESVCGNMTVLNGVAYCDSVPCSLRGELPPFTCAFAKKPVADCPVMDENTQLRAELKRVKAERDAALDDLNGLCWCCIHGTKWEKAPDWSSLTFCEHLGGSIAAAGNAKRKCEHWQWRGRKINDE